MAEKSRSNQSCLFGRTDELGFLGNRRDVPFQSISFPFGLSYLRSKLVIISLQADIWWNAYESLILNLVVGFLFVSSRSYRQIETYEVMQAINGMIRVLHKNPLARSLWARNSSSQLFVGGLKILLLFLFPLYLTCDFFFFLSLCWELSQEISLFYHYIIDLR